jgi:hypothetical protein
MMLGGVGYQAGLDEVRRKQQASLRAAQAAEPDIVAQLKNLAALHESGALSPEEFQAAKRKVLGG